MCASVNVWIVQRVTACPVHTGIAFSDSVNCCVTENVFVKQLVYIKTCTLRDIPPSQPLLFSCKMLPSNNMLCKPVCLPSACEFTCVHV